MVKHLMYVPFTGLGLYGGFRGNRWLRNRIQIFKQFVVPSLKMQSNQNFILWVSWRWEEKTNPQVQELERYLKTQGFDVVFTYSGVCFWDDKYSDHEAWSRLADAVHGAVPELLNHIGEADTILMTIQPSDDCYSMNVVEDLQDTFAAKPEIEAIGFSKGYVMDYINTKVAEWNPTTTPPFFTIKFPREKFLNPVEHLNYTGPYKSHEYIGDKLKFMSVDERCFLVGTHGENISTIFNHPFAAPIVEEQSSILMRFGLLGLEPLTLPVSLRKKFMRRLPHGWQRKIRYLLGEKFAARIYNFLRS